MLLMVVAGNCSGSGSGLGVDDCPSLLTKLPRRCSKSAEVTLSVGLLALCTDCKRLFWKKFCMAISQRFGGFLLAMEMNARPTEGRPTFLRDSDGIFPGIMTA